jgi:prepilin-type N-terminal cleavage/methylation domain-containing protein
MISTLRKQKGFTIIELLIVIVVIGILAALVITTFAGIQERARNTERETDIKAIHSQLESYYAQGAASYPSAAQLGDSAANGWVETNLRGIDLGALTAPGQTGNSVVAANPSIDNYFYEPTGCDTNGVNCSDYTLTANLEGGGTFVREGLN